MTKKKPLMITLTIAVIGICIFYFYPQQLSSVISEGDTISIVYIHHAVQNGGQSMDSAIFEFTSNTDGYADIVNLFGQYSYYRNLASLFKSTGMEYKNRGVDYYLNIYIGHSGNSKNIIMGGDGKVIVEDHLYKMGFWGTKYQVKFMEQLKHFLEKNQHAIQTT